jgi:hypothetical protein
VELAAAQVQVDKPVVLDTQGKLVRPGQVGEPVLVDIPDLVEKQEKVVQLDTLVTADLQEILDRQARPARQDTAAHLVPQVSVARQEFLELPGQPEKRDLVAIQDRVAALV